jgi:hypothetical protein
MAIYAYLHLIVSMLLAWVLIADFVHSAEVGTTNALTETANSLMEASVSISKAPSMPEEFSFGRVPVDPNSSSSVYPNCVPFITAGTAGISNLLNKCTSCLLGGACPLTCCIARMPQVEQIRICEVGGCCMRMFGPSFSSLWSWDGSIQPGSPDQVADACSNALESDKTGLCGTPCAIRFGLDALNRSVLAPCPVGEPTGLVVPNSETLLMAPALCTTEPVPDNSLGQVNGTMAGEPLHPNGTIFSGSVSPITSDSTVAVPEQVPAPEASTGDGGTAVTGTISAETTTAKISSTVLLSVATDVVTLSTESWPPTTAAASAATTAVSIDATTIRNVIPEVGIDLGTALSSPEMSPSKEDDLEASPEQEENPLLECVQVNATCASSPGTAYMPLAGCCLGECIERFDLGPGRFCTVDQEHPTSTSGQLGFENTDCGSALSTVPDDLVPMSSLEPPPCTPVGERCAGALGMEFVSLMDCCSGICMTDVSKGWGKFCTATGNNTSGTASTASTEWIESDAIQSPEASEKQTPISPTGEEISPKCTALGDRCMSAVGYPHVEWGKFCIIPPLAIHSAVPATTNVEIVTNVGGNNSSR